MRIERKRPVSQEANGSGINRPYAAPSNVIDILKRIRSRNLPDRVDSDYLRAAGVPDGSIYRVVFALRFLDLVDNDSPTADLRAIATSTDEEYRVILERLIRTAYRDVFDVVDPGEDGSEKIANVFRRYVPASQRDRMVVFFLGMCREAGIPTLDTPRQRSSGVAPGAHRSGGRSRQKPVQPGARSATGGTGQSTAYSIDLHPALEMLVRSLPQPGTTMPQEKREQWIDMATAALAFIYPEDEPEPDETVS
ncbi:MAG: DUF5343 domain-containing protein [Candidatus Binatia bacterium]